ncbi:MAG: hypothetical protein H0W63_09355 [Gemmatimonadaceae bacterium]|nr:hypothetical protein [Gemmatimonadaceae bacterium]
MTRQKRTRLAFLALVPVVVFAAVRCADSSAPLPSVQKSIKAPTAEFTARLSRLHEETDWVGEFHNDALRYVFNSISRVPAKGRDKRSVCETARRAYAQFHHARRGTEVPASVDAQLESFCVPNTAPAARATVSGGSNTESRREVSAAAEGLMDQIASAIDASTSSSDLSDRVNSIEASAASSLSYEEATDVFIVGSVALSSAAYWANNLSAWVPFTNSADYAVLLTTRLVLPGDASAPFGGSNAGQDWGEYAEQVWRDTRAAAKRAAGGDARAGIKYLIGSAIGGLPILWDVIIGAAAAGSIGAVLQL